MTLISLIWIFHCSYLTTLFFFCKKDNLCTSLLNRVRTTRFKHRKRARICNRFFHWTLVPFHVVMGAVYHLACCAQWCCSRRYTGSRIPRLWRTSRPALSKRCLSSHPWNSIGWCWPGCFLNRSVFCGRSMDMYSALFLPSQAQSACSMTVTNQALMNGVVIVEPWYQSSSWCFLH